MTERVERLRGSIVPLVTPFDTTGALDEAALRRLIDWQIAEGSHGISVGGSTGEPGSLSTDERLRLFRVTVETVGGRVPVVLGTGSDNLDETLRLTTEAARMGADAALVVVPYYSRPTQEGLFQYFVTVARAVPDFPLIVYNIPGRTAQNLEPTTLRRLRRACPNIVGVKEANRDFEQVSAVLHEVGRDFLVYSGIESLCFPLLAVGGAGYVSATGNVLPRAVAELYNLVRAGRWEAARDLHFYLWPLNQALFWETNPGPVKACLGMLGRCAPTLRLPLVPPSPEHQAGLRRLLVEYGLLTGEEPA